MGVETRYMRGDTWTINGHTGYKLQLTKNGSLRVSSNAAAGNVAVYFGLRGWIIHADSSTEEFTSGTPSTFITIPVGQQDTDYVDRSGNYTPSQKVMVATDAVKVIVYIKFGTGSWIQTTGIFITEQIGAAQLDSNQWTITLNTYRYYDSDENLTYGEWRWGYTLNSCIDGFSWSVAAAVIGKRLLLGVGK